MFFRIVVVIILLFLSACQGANDQGGASIQQLENDAIKPNKKVVLVMIDSMMGSLIDNSKEKGKIPALEFLIENGQYHKDLVAPFPSMSVVIESTLMTGQMPNSHKVPGLVWYKPDENRMVDYGSTIEKMVKLGMRQSLMDSLYHLNNSHLSPKVTTIHEALQQKKYSTGSVNFLIYRGKTTHDMTLPVLLDQWLNLNDSLQTKGPDLLAFGSAVKPKVIEDKELPDTFLSNFGLNDEYSVKVVSEMIKQGEQPDFLAVFLPDFDKEAHENSPHYRVGFERAETFFQEILNSYESWDKALEENIFIVFGDHGQDKLLDDELTMAIPLDEIYNEYSIAQLTDNVSHGEIAIANNHRMSYIYPMQDIQLVPRLAEVAMTDKRVQFASWVDENWVYVISPDYKEGFRFRPGGPWIDRYGQTWEWEGNEQIVGIEVDRSQSKLKYTDYPDVLNQLISSLNSNDYPSVLLTAKPGHTFQSEGAPLHVDGGEHGGLHKNDTLAAIIIAGTDKRFENPRIVDLKEYILQFFQ
ncbi:alkaline phosphatase family protein [Alkalihalobacterium alkalinitrilicum]|uniref:alkaline phosphatase family protein n=1 Tax=Alkalihalobacterium alkalinitrilicum TaxID=427920 RepID=UPI0009958895|nr:alkaline phosphatase family protein [Alkalihalobacterium alkalinitrilicum]